MGRQPNVELSESDRPRRGLEPGPSVKWRADKPGIPSSPLEVPKGGGFGVIGPDHGWAWKVVSGADLPDDDPRLRMVVTGLVMARAGALGRAAIAQDVEAALAIAGFGEESRPDLDERRQKWLEASGHDQRPGATAVSEVDLSMLIQKPERIRWAVRHTAST